MYLPTEEEIEKIRKQLGFDYVQARNHLITRAIARGKMVPTERRGIGQFIDLEPNEAAKVQAEIAIARASRLT